MKFSIYSGDANTGMGMSWLCRIVAIFFDLQTFNSIENGKYSMFCCLFDNGLIKFVFFELQARTPILIIYCVQCATCIVEDAYVPI
jgi:hypothetical protein